MSKEVKNKGECDRLIGILCLAVDSVKSGNMSYQIANSMSNAAGKAVQAARGKIEYALAKNEVPEIPFFE